jgi:hypothetical protein
LGPYQTPPGRAQPEKRQQSEHIAAHKCFGDHRVEQEPLRNFGSPARVDIDSAATFITGLNR